MRPQFLGDPLNPLQVSVEAPDQDLLIAGRILHAIKFQARSVKPLDTILLERVAHIVVDQGRISARAWLDGYYYATGTRNHATVSALYEVLSR